MTDPEALIDAARESTGLEDFGGEGFREGLSVLAKGLDEEAELNAVGRQVAHGQLSRLLANRLHITDWCRRHPEITAQAVPAPIFVLGLPRTGTTALSGLLAADPGTRSLRTWESLEPTPPPETASQRDDPRIARTAQGLALMHRMFPEFRSMHDAEAEGPTECQDLLGLEFKAQHFSGQFHMPSYEAWVCDCDMVPAYHTHKRVLQLLQWRCPPTRWHLKTPVHMLSLPALAEVYPDARFVMTHRDPARVLGSVCSLIQAMYRMASGWDDPVRLGAEQLALWSEALRRAVAFRASAPAHRFADLSFAELQSDPVGALERTYDTLDVPFPPEARRAIEAHLASHPPGRHGAHRYRLSDFSLEADAVRDAFRFYLEAYDVPEEEVA